MEAKALVVDLPQPLELLTRLSITKAWGRESKTGQERG